MSNCELDVGTIVQFARASTVAGADSGEYRVEQLLMLSCGTKLYKIKSAAEPFDRIVSELQPMRMIVALIFLLATPALLRADVPDVKFGGQSYHLGLEYQGDAAGGSNFAAVEFTLNGETVDDWTKLFAFHDYAGLDAEPAVAAATVSKTVLEQYKDASLAITDVPGSNEAILDFLTYDPERDAMEFDIFKYARAPDGGLIALQFAQRFPAQDFDKKAFQALRTRLVDEMARTDVAPAQTYFAMKAKS